jgi:hypothetical protein
MDDNQWLAERFEEHRLLPAAFGQLFQPFLVLRQLFAQLMADQRGEQFADPVAVEFQGDCDE